MANGEVYCSLALACRIKSTLYEMFLHRSAWSLGVFVEQKHSLRQLTVVESFGFQHVCSHLFITSICDELLDTHSCVLAANLIESIVEGKIPDVVEILLLEIRCRDVVIGINESEHVLEHSRCST